jgi:molecular chaperone GrpE
MSKMNKKKKNADNDDIGIANPDNDNIEVESTDSGGNPCEGETGIAQISEIDNLKDQLLRQAAEYDNYRKRTAKERLELVPEITAANITQFLPVIDNIERALQADCSDSNYKKGIEMVYDSFMQTLKNLGVEEITQEDFNPAVHQAVQNIEHDSLQSGKVAQVFQKGYKIGNRIIRFAMVAIVK